LEAHGLWDFLLTTSENEEEEEVLPVSTRSKGPVDTTPSNQNQNSPASPNKYKGIVKKSSTPSSDYVPTTKSSSSSKTLIFSDNMEYNTVEDMKMVKANISLYEVSKLKQ